MRLLLESTVTSFDAADPDLFLSAATTETYFWARATEVVSGCIQLYGAIGFTWEFGHHFFLVGSTVRVNIGVLVVISDVEALLRAQVIGRTRRGVPNDWTVVNADGIPHLLAAGYLNHLTNVEVPPTTRRAYAYDLAAYLTFLDARQLSVDDVTNEVLGQFIRWLRAPDANVVAVSDVSAARARSTANRALCAVSSFYRYLGTGGPSAQGFRGYQRLRDSASIFRRADLGPLGNVGNARRHREGRRLGPRLARSEQKLTVLTVQQVHRILEGCPTYQYRLFFTLAFTTGMRIGQILGLRHSDIDTRRRTVEIVPRDDNENGARAKTRKSHQVPITREVARLYTTYMHEEYRYIDSDYAFISLSGKHIGEALTASTIYSAVDSIKRRTGLEGWTPHTLRHTYVTLQRRAGVPIDVISNLVTHANLQTTVDIYSHLSVEDLRNELIRAGAWETVA